MINVGRENTRSAKQPMNQGHEMSYVIVWQDFTRALRFICRVGFYDDASVCVKEFVFSQVTQGNWLGEAYSTQQTRGRYSSPQKHFKVLCCFSNLRI